MNTILTILMITVMTYEMPKLPYPRKIFLENLSDDFVGLTSTLQNLLGFLNLAELGSWLTW